jgi:hypothetical protein
MYRGHMAARHYSFQSHVFLNWWLSFKGMAHHIRLKALPCRLILETRTRGSEISLFVFSLLVSYEKIVYILISANLFPSFPFRPKPMKSSCEVLNLYGNS